MPMFFSTRRRDVCAGAAAGLMAVCSQWMGRSHASDALPARMRLLAGGRDGEGRLLAGVQLSLQPGWKTYWRLPGGSGIPPIFDWSASLNAKSVIVSYPAPSRLGEGPGMFLGYTGDVVFPVEVIPADPASDVELVLDLTYGVCERICIPAESQARLRFASGSPADDAAALIERARARVPRRVPAGTMIRDWRYLADQRRIEFAVDALGGVDFVAVEGQVDLDLGMAVEVASSGPLKRFSVSLGGPSAAPPASPILVTIVSRRAAVEEAHTLDG
ncbi:protein-disulfide reductase DsbD domain-containing protein [Candidatus Raskinella chloraquaticus]|jgi:DsbC/DsbD-like thiol-disulfide interchange protein|uniref:Thiol:disulfide interchange protein DsbD N-terminal domain-containing protein n=1 Tax=Candidatus Raskinella chloraquaticus TaxID=1951219 RepID=A0A1W9I2J8_9HYPH|nr:MAG: hypothetical protein A4S15_00155 [Proteobacteria bacterium SG_bin8]